jgi:tetratricopeptide (TPR) repeat protein
MKKMISFISICIFFSACAPAAVNRPEKKVAQINPKEMADAHEKAGNYLLASYYFEAAITAANEKELLPRLIYDQVKAGRLHAALASLERLYKIEPDYPNLKGLYELINQLTGAKRKISQKENTDDSQRNF